MSKVKRIILSLVATLSLAAPLAVPAFASAATTDVPGNLKCGANLSFAGAESGTCTDDDTSGTQVDNIVANVINIISLVVGVVAVIMIIVGGLRYITSGGESGSVTGAKNTIMYAIVGLIVVALAQLIVRFVVKKATTTTP